MPRNILILGASYGSLLGTKLLMAGHNVTLVCRQKTAELINRDGTEVRIKLRDEAVHRAIFSRYLPGKLDAATPGDVDVSRYDLAALAMQEPQYTNHTVRVLMVKIAAAGLPCLSIMNMPPLPYLKRIRALADMDLEEAYTNAQVWDRFKPGVVTLCSPDPQAFRPPEEPKIPSSAAMAASVLCKRRRGASTRLPQRRRCAFNEAANTVPQPCPTFANDHRVLRRREAGRTRFRSKYPRVLRRALRLTGRHGPSADNLPLPGDAVPIAYQVAQDRPAAAFGWWPACQTL